MYFTTIKKKGKKQGEIRNYCITSTLKCAKSSWLTTVLLQEEPVNAGVAASELKLRLSMGNG